MTQEDTIFHKIIREEILCDLLYEDELVIALRDINPVSDTHILVIAKKSLPSLADAQAEDKELLGHMLIVCNQLATDLEIADDGYRIVINTGKNGGQTVLQLHMHLLGGRYFDWPPG